LISSPRICEYHQAACEIARPDRAARIASEGFKAANEREREKEYEIIDRGLYIKEAAAYLA
jgi:hypothetical protein